MNYDLPSRRLLEAQAAWLAPARARLLRRANVARRRRLLDLACAGGTTVEELLRRSGGEVVALDRDWSALAELTAKLSENLIVAQPPSAVMSNTAQPRAAGPHFELDKPFRGATVVRGDAERLPFADATFDLVFCQFALVWLDLSAAVAEIRRVLLPGGALAAIEPDYGGLIEHPPEIAVGWLWRSALERAGADPCVGRKLPAALAAAGFDVRADLLDRLEPPSPLRFDLLGELPLTDGERAELDQARRTDAALDSAARVVHLPMFLITAEAP